MVRVFIWAVVAALICSVLPAGQVILQNGDRLTGEILESNQESLVLQSEFAGTVTIKWSAVERITSDVPLHLTLEDSQVLVGTVETVSGRLEVETEQAGRVNLTKEAITTIRSPERQNAYLAELERLRDPGPLDLWRGSADLGLSFARGNSETTNLVAGFNAARTTNRDKISVYANSIYATNSTTGISLTTANAIRGGARYDLNLNERHYIFGLGDLEYDEFQNLDLRTVLGGGYGWHAYKSEDTTFDVFGGGGLNREFFSTGEDRSSAEILVGEELTFKLAERTSLFERLVFFPNLSESGEYRLNFDLSAVTAINSWLNWQVSFSDRFISNPTLGAERNDILLSTGLRVTFGR